MDDHESRLQHIAERTLSANFALWSALLTSHAVVLSVAVALLVTVKPPEAWRFKLAGFIGIACIVLLLLNFVLTKSQYELIGQRLTHPNGELSEAEQNRDLHRTTIRRSLAKIAETSAIFGLGIEVLLLGWVLAAS
jgi:hypothetical protein